MPYAGQGGCSPRSEMEVLSIVARCRNGTAMHLQGHHPSRKQSSLQGGNRRSKPMPDTVFPTPKMNARLARLWQVLLADSVPPHPATTAGKRATFLQGAELREPVLPNQEERVRHNWRAVLARWLQDLAEPEDGGSAPPSAGEENSEPSPFRWEPQRAGLNIPGRSIPPRSKVSDVRRFTPRRLQIPIRPLHKQPFYRRFLFYLRRWLSSSVWQESDPAARRSFPTGGPGFQIGNFFRSSASSQ
jgi:hypothetical protein